MEAILIDVSHKEMICSLLSPEAVKPNKLAIGPARDSNKIVIIPATITVSIIPHLMHSLILSLSFKPTLKDNNEIIVLLNPKQENNAIC